MADVYTALSTFISNIMTGIGSVVNGITTDTVLTVMVLCVPLFGYAITILARLIHGTFRG